MFASRALIVLPILVSVAVADVTIESISKSDGFQGMGAHETTSTQLVQGLKSREDSTIKFKNKLMNMGAGGPKVAITRVDLGKIWSLDLKEKSYTEFEIRPISEMARGSGAPTPGSNDQTPMDTKPTHRIKKSEFDAKKTGQKKNVNGFDAYEVQTTARVEVEEIQSKLVTTHRMEMSTWLASWTPDLKKAAEEHQAFGLAYAKKLGLDIAQADRNVFNTEILGMALGVGGSGSADIIKQIKAKAKLFDGYPVVTESKWYVDEDASIRAQREKALADAETKANTETADVDYAGGAKGIAGSLVGHFAKKKMTTNAIENERGKMGKPMFTAYHEVKKLTHTPIEQTRFEIPTGFKKIEQKAPPPPENTKQ